MKVALGCFLLIPLLIFTTVRTVKKVRYDIDCGGHLKRAADANTVEIAKIELKTTLDYLKENEMTKGYTSVLYQTPDEDIAFWFNNLTQSYGELERVTENASQLEKSNLLIKLRETLLDHGKDGDTVTEPLGISIYPNNVMYAWWALISGLMACVGVGLLLWKIFEH